MSWLYTLVRRFLVLSIITTVWVAILWFVIRIDVKHFNLLSLVGLHALPPLLAWGGWTWWRWHAAATKIKAEEAKKEQVIVEKQEQHDVARKAFDNSLR